MKSWAQPLTEALPWLALALAVVNVLLVVWLLLRRPGPSADQEALQAAQALQASTQILASLHSGNDRLERELRREISDTSRGGRQELAQSFATFQQTLVGQSA